MPLLEYTKKFKILNIKIIFFEKILKLVDDNTNADHKS